jgi:hypothetical protein
MSETKATITVSDTQWEVIEWLFNYPNVYLVWHNMFDTRVYWNVSWADEESRLHMIGVLNEMGVGTISQQAKPRVKPLEGGTPRCTFQTFKSLVKFGIIIRYVDKDGKPTTYFQLHPDTRKQFEAEALEVLFNK